MMKCVHTCSSVFGRPICSLPSAMHFIKNDMFLASTRIVCFPSSSMSACPSSLPWMLFQYLLEATGILEIVKYLLKSQNAMKRFVYSLQFWLVLVLFYLCLLKSSFYLMVLPALCRKTASLKTIMVYSHTSIFLKSLSQLNALDNKYKITTSSSLISLFLHYSVSKENKPRMQI